jgi:hypothetical protein
MFRRQYGERIKDFDGTLCKPKIRRISDARYFYSKGFEKSKWRLLCSMDAKGRGWDTKTLKKINK